MTGTEQTYQLRVLGGPLVGVVYPLGARVEIGRTNKSDIQLIGRGVSRQHAAILTDAEGNHVLIDMLSSNGTWAGGKRIERLRLRPGMHFAIDNTEFVFELAQPFSTGAPQPVAVDDEQWLRRDTVSFDGPRLHTFDDEPATEPSMPPVSPVRHMAKTMGIHPKPTPLPGNRRHSAVFVALPPEPSAAVGAPIAPLSLQARETRKHPAAPALPPPSMPRPSIGFRGPGGSTYEGDLVADIVLFRNLRVKMLHGGGKLAPEQLAQFAALDAKLRQSGEGTGHGDFLRFRCALGATLRLEGDEDRHHDVVVMDLGVDGARISAALIDPPDNALTWLSLPLATGEGTRPAVFTARVASRRGETINLAFAGAPRGPADVADETSTLPRLFVGKRLDREDAS